jgi:hypothetical protein
MTVLFLGLKKSEQKKKKLRDSKLENLEVVTQNTYFEYKNFFFGSGIISFYLMSG